MLVITPRASQLPSIGGGGRRGGTTGDDLVNYYLPVIMAEMAASVSTRDPSIIRVSCRQGFMEDLVGGCRPVFDPTPYFPHNTRPNRHTSVASILPVIRSPPRVTRPEPQTQRDLIRQFNISRGRPAWFGRSLSYQKDTTNSKGPSDSTGRPLIPRPVTTTTTTPSPDTSTPDCDD
ncbi:uncharacterized protein LOC121858697 isoform X2 [Homarus americanus]|uniref:uncharacterized protein LOC121858697 isoform X2 n=1 Tax=Homarus americanus TaxID=6706 RepID=UPI001C493F28|nr:uncharacterized protein LOC121858697 isoform X2 [Homarus americanus]